jgi:hypothetical protein
MTGERSICSGRLMGKSKPLSESIAFARKDGQSSLRLDLPHPTSRERFHA